MSQKFSASCISVYYYWLFGAIFALLCLSLKVSVLFVFLRIAVGCLVQYLLCSGTVSKVQSWLYFGVLPLAVWCNSCFALPLSQSFNPDCISVSYCWFFGAIFALLRHSLTVLVLIVFLCITAGCLVQYLIGSVTVSKFQFWLYFCVLILVAWCNVCFALPQSQSFCPDCISVYYCWLFGAIFALLRHSIKVSVLVVFTCITVGLLVQFLLCSVNLKVSVLVVFLCITVGSLMQYLLCSATVSKFQSWLYFCVLLLVVWCNICFAPSQSQSFSPDCISVYYCWLFGAIFSLFRHSLTVSVMIVFLCITVGCLVQYLLCSATVSKFQSWLYFCVLLLVAWCSICFALPLFQSFSPDCIFVYYCWMLGAIFALLCYCPRVSVQIVFLCLTAGCLVQYLLCSVTVSNFLSWLYFCSLINYSNIVSVWPNQPASYRLQTRPIWKNSANTEKTRPIRRLVLAEFFCIGRVFLYWPSFSILANTKILDL